ncbi:supressor of mif two, 3-like protein 1-like protein [Mycena belliarum]|uniref:Supressor of mif two, 3-like protein 1-like protein n=1 Tax=Mycena belliarum TaxID=1033014 RepID=A0AAD6U197_9AGAR|nr:supressor of mif two, 3-like protein 1-like protein [Mycena belliae]
MSPSGEDVKPDVTKIRIVVQFNGQNTVFLYKKNKPLAKLLNMFCERIGVDRKTVRFNYDGTMVEQEGVTPDSLGMEDEDVIDGQIWQEGGGSI